MNISVDYEKVFEECKSLLRSIEIPIAADENLSMSFDLRTSDPAEAYCIRKDKKNFEIRLKRSYIIGKNPDIRHLKNVIMHELVHTCPDCFKGAVASDHTELFLRYAKMINKASGYNILEFENLSSYRNANEPIKVIGQCDNCGCSRIFRNDKDIEKNPYTKRARLGYETMDFCPYCITKGRFRYKLLVDKDSFEEDKNMGNNKNRGIGFGLFGDAFVEAYLKKKTVYAAVKHTKNPETAKSYLNIDGEFGREVVALRTLEYDKEMYELRNPFKKITLKELFDCVPNMQNVDGVVFYEGIEDYFVNEPTIELGSDAIRKIVEEARKKA